jgi:MFS-type transporter involved in bile tolerance (Atg22 family)
MDTAGLIVIVIFAIGYLATYKKEEQKTLAKICLFGAGVGVGLLIGAIWAYSIVVNTFS